MIQIQLVIMYINPEYYRMSPQYNNYRNYTCRMTVRMFDSSSCSLTITATLWQLQLPNVSCNCCRLQTILHTFCSYKFTLYFVYVLQAHAGLRVRAWNWRCRNFPISYFERSLTTHVRRLSEIDYFFSIKGALTLLVL